MTERIGFYPANLHLGKMFQQIRWVFVHAIGAGSGQFGFAIPAGKQADTKSFGSPCAENVPYAVADDNAIAERDPETCAASRKTSGSGLA